MRVWRRLWVLVAVLFLCGAAGFAQEAEAPFAMSFETSLIKVFPVDVELAEAAGDSAGVRLARNEYEAFQVLVLAKEDLEGVRVTVGDLATKEGAVIPAADIEVNVVGYVPVIKPFYEPYYVRLEGQPKWPDPLLPTDTADIKAEQVQPWWVTVYAGEDAEPGAYSGEVTVAVERDGSSYSASFPLNVRVWDFAVPKESHLRTIFWITPRRLREYHNLERGTQAAYDMNIIYYNEMLAHRMSYIEIGQDAPAPRVEIAEGVEPDFSAWDEWMQGWIDKGLNSFSVPLRRNDPREVMIMKARAWGKHLDEKGWLDMASVFLVDETTGGKEQRLWVHEGYPKLKNALTWRPVPECPNVDIWIPQIERGFEAYPETIKWARWMGKELWMYSSSPQSGPRPEDTAFYPNTNIDFPATHCRLLPWVCWRENLSGYLYWSVNYWAENPWETAENFRRQNGNGSFFYPGDGGPVVSLRAKAFRDGMEDYEYFRLLKMHADAARDDASQAELVALSDEALALWKDTRSFMNYINRHPERLYKARNWMGELIEKFKRQ